MLVDRDHLVLDEAFADAAAVPSPCISVCRMDPQTRWCEGCLRTIDEIVDWSGFDADERRAVWHMLPARFDQLATLAGKP
ncbi:hypothetical protein BH10PSE17_BH10PSE17_33230 [soil metagenome]